MKLTTKRMIAGLVLLLAMAVTMGWLIHRVFTLANVISPDFHLSHIGYWEFNLPPVTLRHFCLLCPAGEFRIILSKLNPLVIEPVNHCLTADAN